MINIEIIKCNDSYDQFSDSLKTSLRKLRDQITLYEESVNPDTDFSRLRSAIALEESIKNFAYMADTMISLLKNEAEKIQREKDKYVRRAAFYKDLYEDSAQDTIELIDIWRQKIG